MLELAVFSFPMAYSDSTYVVIGCSVPKVLASLTAAESSTAATTAKVFDNTMLNVSVVRCTCTRGSEAGSCLSYLKKPSTCCNDILAFGWSKEVKYLFHLLVSSTPSGLAVPPTLLVHHH